MAEPSTASSAAHPVRTPRDGVPHLFTTPAEFLDAAQALAAGHGILALDTERASGFTYSQRAQLIQLRRAGAGSFLLDPTAVDDPRSALAPLAEVINPLRWLLHAADQDLPCLRELGLTPASLGDTLLAGRLLGYQKCNLGNLTEQVLGLHLAKSHSAENWSHRPLPSSWLNYAALDVEYLIELWDKLMAEAEDRGRAHWVAEECEFERLKPDPPPKQDPWRGTSQIHTLRQARQLEVVRCLWLSRDALAERKDIAPGRLLPDRMIISLAQAQPTSEKEFLALKGTQRIRYRHRWISAITQALKTPQSDLPSLRARRPHTLPPQSQWKRTNPDAAAYLTQCRQVAQSLAEELGIETQDLIAGEALRNLSWGLTSDTPPQSVAASLQDSQARPWQISLVAAPLASKLGIGR